jgi:hypothetical protein
MSNEPLIDSVAEWRRFAASHRSCSGTPDCSATTHLHGCYADLGDCNLPEEHDHAE